MINVRKFLHSVFIWQAAKLEDILGIYSLCEMKSATQVQMQGKVVCVSLSANALGKCMDQSLLTPQL